MKVMTCRQLGGACEKKFYADSFENIAELSKTHGIEMFQNRDEDHLKAMEKMKELMSNPRAMEKWVQSKKEEFDSLPDSN